MGLRRMQLRACQALLIATAVATLAAESALAQSYPTRPVRLIAASAPGGTSDILARLLAQHLTTDLGQQFVVDNRAGASGIIGTDLVAKAAPDGHTLLLIQPSLTINPHIFAKVPHDAVRDFAPISLVVDVPQVVSVYRQSRQTLPLLTQALLATSDFLRATGWLWLVIIVAAAVSFVVAWRQPAARARIHGALLRVPGVGRLAKSLDTARYASTLAILVGSGAPLLRYASR